MNVADVWRTLIRHPVWLVLGILLAVVAGGLTFQLASPEQQSTSAVVILPPTITSTDSGSGTTDVTGQNPFLNLDNTLAQLATVLSSALNSDAVRDQLDDAGATGSYTIANTTSDNPSFAQLSPQLTFTVTAASADVATRTAAALITAAGQQLQRLQDDADVPSSARAREVTVASASAGTVAGNSQIRAAGVVGLVVLVLAAIAIVLVDVGVTRRRRRRELAADTLRYRTGRIGVTAAGTVGASRLKPADTGQPRSGVDS